MKIRPVHYEKSKVDNTEAEKAPEETQAEEKKPIAKSQSKLAAFLEASAKAKQEAAANPSSPQRPPALRTSSPRPDTPADEASPQLETTPQRPVSATVASLESWGSSDRHGEDELPRPHVRAAQQTLRRAGSSVQERVAAFERTSSSPISAGAPMHDEGGEAGGHQHDGSKPKKKKKNTRRASVGAPVSAAVSSTGAAASSSREFKRSATGEHGSRHRGHYHHGSAARAEAGEAESQPRRERKHTQRARGTSSRKLDSADSVDRAEAEQIAAAAHGGRARGTLARQHSGKSKRRVARGTSSSHNRSHGRLPSLTSAAAPVPPEGQAAAASASAATQQADETGTSVVSAAEREAKL